MPNLIAIANFIGINELGITPPFGGQDIITEINTLLLDITNQIDPVTREDNFSSTQLSLFATTIEIR